MESRKVVTAPVMISRVDGTQQIVVNTSANSTRKICTAIRVGNRMTTIAQ